MQHKRKTSPKMATYYSSSLILVVLLFLVNISCNLEVAFGDSNVDRKVYIVYMGSKPEDDIHPPSLHKKMLHQVLDSREDASNHLRHSYSKSFHGFSATLTEDEAQLLAGMEGVLSVFPSQNLKLHTTRTWDFLGMPVNVARSNSESDIIVGVIDTGIWPKWESFSGKGYGPPPKRWKGKCQFAGNFTCNNKLVGAQYFRANKTLPEGAEKSPIDTEGHGTHTASTAAGNMVNNVSFHGIRPGTARGGVPRARIAIYKACWPDSCPGEDLLAAFDAAIADGVDLISISAGGNGALPYFQTEEAIGGFHAMQRGILTVQAAGNEGPYPQTISSVAPWVVTVGASTHDRKMVTPVKLGNNMVFNGVSLVNTIILGKKMYPLIYAGDAAKAGVDVSTARKCVAGSLDEKLVRDKIVMCDGEHASLDAPVMAGAPAAILRTDDPRIDLVSPLSYPVALLPADQINNITNYIRSTKNPTGIVMKSTEIPDAIAPKAATFSSRGPNPINPKILKPDILAPGVGILAAWTSLAGSPSQVPYTFASGTSMACPHVSGIAAYIKTFHPAWSPAAIKSAIMTTATPMSNGGNFDQGEFAYGSGHVNPNKAVDPGLVYDADEFDYVKVLCEEGYTISKIRSITGHKNSSCSSNKGSKQLNYPSFVASTVRNIPVNETFIRTVTNVGSPSSTYKAVIKLDPEFNPDNVLIQVKPTILKFEKVGQMLSFQVEVMAIFEDLDKPMMSASLTWDDGVHKARSPIVVYVPT